ncbi:MAG: carotenoid biosynthesis protein [Chloroflexi bacterium]|nr:carotenoid biosynthesis protein [Chloroflexota bacterium]
MFGLTTRPRLAVAALFGFYLFLYPWSIALIALDRVPVWGTWMGGALLILQGALMGLWLAVNFGRWGILASLWVLFLSWLIEHVGASTGFPFGSYSYTDVLQPQVFGVVPLAIPFAWLLIVTSAMGVAGLFLYPENRTTGSEARVSVGRVLIATAFALLLDVTIEPFAVHINHYWTWSDSDPGLYYGIPASNFIAWWFTSLLLSWVLALHRSGAARATRTAPGRHGRPFWLWLPLTLYLTNLTMFVVVNLARGQATAAIIGGLIFAVIAGRGGVPRLVRRLRARAEQESGA